MTIATITKRLRLLAAEASNLAAEIELEDAKAAKANWRATIQAQTLLAIVCRRFELTAEMIQSRTRTPRVADGRLVFLALGRKYKLAADMDLSRMVFRERSLVNHAVNRVADYCATDPKFAATVDAIDHEFQQTFYAAAA